MAVAAGLPGLALYLCLAGTGFHRAFKAAKLRRDRLAQCAFGVLVAMVFHWLNGGQYSVAILPWFLLGWLDRAGAEASESTDPQRSSEVAVPRPL
jgi:O-antigen ligase